MGDCIILKVLLYGELADATRKVGRSKLRSKDSFKARLKSLNIQVESRKPLLPIDPHGTWWAIKEPKKQNKSRTQSAIRKRAARKALNASYTSEPQTIPRCSTCERQFRAKIGFVSHLRRHSTKQKCHCHLRNWWTNNILVFKASLEQTWTCSLFYCFQGYQMQNPALYISNCGWLVFFF